MASLTDSDWFSLESLKVLAALTSFLLLSKLFESLSLFEGTAFYMRLIYATWKDILQFMILFCLALLMFGLPINLLNSDGRNKNENINSNFGHWIFDVMFGQYLIALGEFAILES